MMDYRPTPVLEITEPLLARHGVRLLVKREDLNHPFISGNKWWKLSRNVNRALTTNHRTIVTMGGAYSNHIYATAAAGKEAGLKTIGIIRGEHTAPLNPTLEFASANGMLLHFVSREEYRRMSHDEDPPEIFQRFGPHTFIPEGGSNADGILGAQDFAEKIIRHEAFDYLFLATGTGGTLAGIANGLRGYGKIMGVSVLKNGQFLSDRVKSLIEKTSSPDYGNWRLLTSYDHGGYAKVTDDLMRFIVKIRSQHNLPLDPIYTAKTLFAIYKEIDAGSFPRGSTILMIHTGGLQGALTILSRFKAT